MLKKLLSVLIALVSLFVTACDANYEPVGYNGYPAYVYLTNPGTVSVENVASTTGNNTFTGTNNFTLNVTLAGINGLVIDAPNNTQSMRVGWNVGNTMTGLYNFLFGVNAGSKLTTGEGNHLFGTSAGANITIGKYNVAIGDGSLWGINQTTSGNFNIAIGDHALRSLSTGTNNVAIGSEALRNISTGHNNTGVGHNSLYSITTGRDNVALGFKSGNGLTSGQHNTILGSYAAPNLATGTRNIAIGRGAGQDINGNNELVIDTAEEYKDKAFIFGDMAASVTRFLRLCAARASAGFQAGFDFILRGQYWTGTDTNYLDFHITHNITNGGNNPSTNVTFSVNNTNIMKLESINGTAGFFLSANGTLSKVYKGSANTAGTGYAILMVEN